MCWRALAIRRSERLWLLLAPLSECTYCPKESANLNVPVHFQSQNERSEVSQRHSFHFFCLCSLSAVQHPLLWFPVVMENNCKWEELQGQRWKTCQRWRTSVKWRSWWEDQLLSHFFHSFLEGLFTQTTQSSANIKTHLGFGLVWQDSENPLPRTLWKYCCSPLNWRNTLHPKYYIVYQLLTPC